MSTAKELIRRFREDGAQSRALRRSENGGEGDHEPWWLRPSPVAAIDPPSSVDFGQPASSSNNFASRLTFPESQKKENPVIGGVRASGLRPSDDLSESESCVHPRGEPEPAKPISGLGVRSRLVARLSPPVGVDIPDFGGAADKAGGLSSLSQSVANASVAALIDLARQRASAIEGSLNAPFGSNIRRAVDDAKEPSDWDSSGETENISGSLNAAGELPASVVAPLELGLGRTSFGLDRPGERFGPASPRRSVGLRVAGSVDGALRAVCRAATSVSIRRGGDPRLEAAAASLREVTSGGDDDEGGDRGSALHGGDMRGRLSLEAASARPLPPPHEQTVAAARARGYRGSARQVHPPLKPGPQSSRDWLGRRVRDRGGSDGAHQLGRDANGLQGSHGYGDEFGDQDEFVDDWEEEDEEEDEDSGAIDESALDEGPGHGLGKQWMLLQGMRVPADARDIVRETEGRRWHGDVSATRGHGGVRHAARRIADALDAGLLTYQRRLEAARREHAVAGATAFAQLQAKQQHQQFAAQMRAHAQSVGLQAALERGRLPAPSADGGPMRGGGGRGIDWPGFGDTGSLHMRQVGYDDDAIRNRDIVGTKGQNAVSDGSDTLDRGAVDEFSGDGNEDVDSGQGDGDVDHGNGEVDRGAGQHLFREYEDTSHAHDGRVSLPRVHSSDMVAQLGLGLNWKDLVPRESVSSTLTDLVMEACTLEGCDHASEVRGDCPQRDEEVIASTTPSGATSAPGVNKPGMKQSRTLDDSESQPSPQPQPRMVPPRAVACLAGAAPGGWPVALIPTQQLAKLWRRKRAARSHGLSLADPWKDAASAGSPEQGAAMALAAAGGLRKPMWVRLMPSRVPALAIAVDVSMDEDETDDGGAASDIEDDEGRGIGSPGDGSSGADDDNFPAGVAEGDDAPTIQESWVARGREDPALFAPSLEEQAAIDDADASADDLQGELEAAERATQQWRNRGKDAARRLRQTGQLGGESRVRTSASVAGTWTGTKTGGDTQTQGKSEDEVEGEAIPSDGLQDAQDELAGAPSLVHVLGLAQSDDARDVAEAAKLLPKAYPMLSHGMYRRQLAAGLLAAEGAQAGVDDKAAEVVEWVSTLPAVRQAKQLPHQNTHERPHSQISPYLVASGGNDQRNGVGGGEEAPALAAALLAAGVGPDQYPTPPSQPSVFMPLSGNTGAYATADGDGEAVGKGSTASAGSADALLGEGLTASAVRVSEETHRTAVHQAAMAADALFAASIGSASVPAGVRLSRDADTREALAAAGASIGVVGIPNTATAQGAHYMLATGWQEAAAAAIGASYPVDGVAAPPLPREQAAREWALQALESGSMQRGEVNFGGGSGAMLRPEAPAHTLPSGQVSVFEPLSNLGDAGQARPSSRVPHGDMTTSNDGESQPSRSGSNQPHSGSTPAPPSAGSARNGHEPVAAASGGEEDGEDMEGRWLQQLVAEAGATMARMSAQPGWVSDQARSHVPFPALDPSARHARLTAARGPHVSVPSRVPNAKFAPTDSPVALVQGQQQMQAQAWEVAPSGLHGRRPSGVQPAWEDHSTDLGQGQLVTGHGLADARHVHSATMRPEGANAGLEGLLSQGGQQRQALRQGQRQGQGLPGPRVHQGVGHRNTPSHMFPNRTDGGQGTGSYDQPTPSYGRMPAVGQQGWQPAYGGQIPKKAVLPRDPGVDAMWAAHQDVLERARAVGVRVP